MTGTNDASRCVRGLAERRAVRGRHAGGRRRGGGLRRGAVPRAGDGGRGGRHDRARATCSRLRSSGRIGWELSLEERLRWAVLYASLSVRVPTALAGAATQTALVQAGAEQGLTLPGSLAAVSMKEEEG